MLSRLEVWIAQWSWVLRLAYQAVDVLGPRVLDEVDDERGPSSQMESMMVSSPGPWMPFVCQLDNLPFLVAEV